MKAQRGIFFSEASKSASSASGDVFFTWCELRDNRCIILVQIPDLRRYKGEAKDAMCKLAWMNANLATNKFIPNQDKLALTVGVRGFLLYERVMSGAPGKEPSESIEGSDGKERLRLYELFAPTPAASTATGDVVKSFEPGAPSTH